jgi:membrane-associated phospholipid phosphatase
MDAVLAWGLEVVRDVQSFFGPAMLVPMKSITFFGSETFALAMLPLLFWCVDREKGARIGIAFLLSAFLNLWVKDLLMQPRPYDLEPALGLIREHTPGLPSGHAQSSLTLWGMLVGILPGWSGIAALVAVPLLVALSRLYLGAHFPTDILGGWVLAGFVLFIYHAFGNRIAGKLSSWNIRVRIIITALIALSMNALLPGDTMLGGAFFGCVAGFVLSGYRLRFSAEGSPGHKILRYLAGISGLAVLYALPKLLLSEEMSHDQLVRFLRYAAVGFWACFGAPWFFVRLGLARLEQPEDPAEA